MIGSSVTSRISFLKSWKWNVNVEPVAADVQRVVRRRSRSCRCCSCCRRSGRSSPDWRPGRWATILLAARSDRTAFWFGGQDADRPSPSAACRRRAWGCSTPAGPRESPQLVERIRPSGVVRALVEPLERAEEERDRVAAERIRRTRAAVLRRLERLRRRAALPGRKSLPPVCRREGAEQRAAQLVGARLRDHVDDAADRAPLSALQRCCSTWNSWIDS